jgi:hypothetical protein
MAAPKNIIEQVLEAISVIPFARTVAEIEVARAHLGISFAAIWESVICLCATSGWRFDNGDTAGHIYYGDRHSMAITIAVSS